MLRTRITVAADDWDLTRFDSRERIQYVVQSNVRMLHHRQRLALVVEPGEHLRGVHAELHNLQSHIPANRFTLLRQIHGAHAAFTKCTNDPIPAEVVITHCRSCCIDGLSCGFFPSGRTIESAQDKTPRA